MARLRMLVMARIPREAQLDGLCLSSKNALSGTLFDRYRLKELIGHLVPHKRHAGRIAMDRPFVLAAPRPVGASGIVPLQPLALVLAQALECIVGLRRQT